MVNESISFVGVGPQFMFIYCRIGFDFYQDCQRLCNDVLIAVGCVLTILMVWDVYRIMFKLFVVFDFSVFHLWRCFRKCFLLRTQAHTRSPYDPHMIHTAHTCKDTCTDIDALVDMMHTRDAHSCARASTHRRTHLHAHVHAQLRATD